jgi:signal transduction histidine kinase
VRAYVDDHPYRPQLPVPITGYTTQPDGSQVAYFTTGSITPGGPTFRVRAEKLAGKSRAGTGAATRRPEQHPAHALPDRAGRDRGRARARPGRRMVVGPARPAPARRRGAHGRLHRGRRPRPACSRRRPGHGGGPAGPRPQRDARADSGGVLGAWRLGVALAENEQHLRQFVADASHELRTPIAAVSAYAELFERGGAEHSEDLPRIVSGIRTETARMDRLVNDLLTLARLDEGVPMEMAPVELVSLVSDAVRTAAAVGPAWPVQFSAARPVEVNGDKDRLRQVLDNLLANIRAHTPEGTTATVHVDQIGDQAQIEVRDTGPGMLDSDAPTGLRALLPGRPGPGPHPGRQRAGGCRSSPPS